MGSGIGAPLVTFTNGVTADGPTVSNNFSLLNQYGLANDGGAISTNGSGGIIWPGKLISNTETVFDATGFDTFLYSRGGANLIHFKIGANNEVAAFGLGSPALQLQTGNATLPSAIQVGVAFGVMDNNGKHLFEVKSNGNAVIPGQYGTAGGSNSIATGQPFDNFDVGEVYPCDAFYESGTLVCPGEHDVLTRCTHDGCPCAMVISHAPGMQLGQMDAERFILPVALVGRVVVFCEGEITPRQLLTCNGSGGVRAMEAGELGFSVGFALNKSAEGKVGLYVRGGYCVAK